MVGYLEEGDSAMRVSVGQASQGGHYTGLHQSCTGGLVVHQQHIHHLQCGVWSVECGA